MKMEDFILKVFSFVAHFDGFEFMYQNNAYVMYIIFFALSVSMIKDYLGSIYGIKKSEKYDYFFREISIGDLIGNFSYYCAREMRYGDTGGHYCAKAIEQCFVRIHISFV